MDFFERQERAHRNTKLLVLYFIIGVVSLVAAVYLVSVLVFTGYQYYSSPAAHGPIHLNFWNPKLLLEVTLGTVAVIGIGSGFKIMELSRGGSAVAAMLGGRLISSTTTDPNEPN